MAELELKLQDRAEGLKTFLDRGNPFREEEGSTVINVGLPDDPTRFDVSQHMTSTYPMVPEGPSSLETIFNVGKKVVKGGLTFAKDVLQETARSGGSIGLTLTGVPEMSLEQQESEIARKIQKFIFGGRPLESIQTRIEKAPARAKETFGIPEEIGEKIAIPIVLGFTALDFTGFGGKKKAALKALSKGAKIFKATGKLDDVVRILKSLKIGDDILPDVARKVAQITDPKKIALVVDDALKTGGRAVREAVTSPKAVERGFITTVKTSPVTAPEVAKGIKGVYTPLANKPLVEEAAELISKNLDEAVKIAKGPGPATAKSNVVSQLLVNKYQLEGRFQDAIDLVERTAQKATTQGQAIQALSIYNRLTPEGALRFANNLVDRANEARKLVGPRRLKVSTDSAKAIFDQATKARGMLQGSREQLLETARLVQMISEQVPASLLKKISGIQTIAQLLNPKTAIRNIVGNFGFAAIENVKDVAAAAIDTPFAIVTGKRIKPLPSLLAQFKGFKRGLVEGTEEALKGLDTSFIPTQFDLPRTPTFTSKIGKTIERLLNLELRAPDRAFYHAARDGSLYQQMKAARVLEPTEAMKEIAHYEGLYRTFQDENVVSKIFVRLKKALNVGKEFGVGDIVLKYPKTPGNLLARGIEYSPAGFVTSLYEMARPLMGKPFNRLAFVESFSRALTGTTGLVGMGALLHRLGIITGRREKDPDVSALERASGLGEYRINVSALKRFVLSGLDRDETKLKPGDTLLNYDWFQPQAIPISIGANIDEGEGIKGMMGRVLEGLAEGVNTLAEQPLISGFRRVMKTQQFSESFKEIAKSIPSSFIPTFLSQVNQLMDNTQRNTYSPETIHYAINLAKAKIPGLAGTLPPRVGVFGEDLERYQGESNNIFNVFFNPAFVSKFKPTEEGQLVMDLMRQTGEKTQFPRLVQRTQSVKLAGQKEAQRIKLTPVQITALQRYVGRISKDMFSSFVEDDAFQALTPDEKVKYLSGVLSDIGMAGKIVVLGHRPERVGKDVLKIISLYR